MFASSCITNENGNSFPFSQIDIQDIVLHAGCFVEVKRQKIHQKDGVYCADPTGVAMMGFLHEAGQRDDTSWQIFSWVGGGIIFVVLIPYFGGYLRIFKALENRAVHCR